MCDQLEKWLVSPGAGENTTVPEPLEKLAAVTPTATALGTPRASEQHSYQGIMDIMAMWAPLLYIHIKKMRVQIVATHQEDLGSRGGNT